METLSMPGVDRVMVAPKPLQRNAALTEGALHDLFSNYTFPLYRLMEYQLGWRDESTAPVDIGVQQTRLHANICLLACQVAGGNPELAVPAAVGVELIYQFTQVHSDIQEGSQYRYGRPTVWWLWGPAQAINTGDGLHALGRLALIQLCREGVAPAETLRSLHALDKACLSMCEGLHQELVYQDRVDITPTNYLDMAKMKMGALLGCAMELGAMAVDSSAEFIEGLRCYGENLGVAFQIQEDIQALWGESLSGKPKGIDVLNKKKIFPVVHALEHAPINQKRQLGTLFFKRVLEPPDCAQVVTILDDLGSRPAAQEIAQKFHAEALSKIDGIGLTPEGRQDLIEVARWLALRE